MHSLIHGVNVHRSWQHFSNTNPAKKKYEKVLCQQRKFTSWIIASLDLVLVSSLWPRNRSWTLGWPKQRSPSWPGVDAFLPNIFYTWEFLSYTRLRLFRIIIFPRGMGGQPPRKFLYPTASPKSSGPFKLRLQAFSFYPGSKFWPVSEVLAQMIVGRAQERICVAKLPV